MFICVRRLEHLLLQYNKKKAHLCMRVMFVFVLAGVLRVVRAELVWWTQTREPGSSRWEETMSWALRPPRCRRGPRLWTPTMFSCWRRTTSATCGMERYAAHARRDLPFEEKLFFKKKNVRRSHTNPRLFDVVPPPRSVSRAAAGMRGWWGEPCLMCCPSRTSRWWWRARSQLNSG